jgi:hypothetical protein
MLKYCLSTFWKKKQNSGDKADGAGVDFFILAVHKTDVQLQQFRKGLSKCYTNNSTCWIWVESKMAEKCVFSAFSSK